MSAAPEFALYGYFRFSAIISVRLALNLKGIGTDTACRLPTFVAARPENELAAE